MNSILFPSKPLYSFDDSEVSGDIEKRESVAPIAPGVMNF
jgi:hypothetical protein